MATGTLPPAVNRVAAAELLAGLPDAAEPVRRRWGAELLYAHAGEVAR